mgnify:CR=1 FL=1
MKDPPSFKSDVVKKLLEGSKAFYEKEFSSYLQEHGVSAYLVHAVDRVQREEMRANSYLSPQGNTDKTDFEEFKNQLYSTCIEKFTAEIQLEFSKFLVDDKRAGK